jgi:hypothetical protein
MLSMNYSVLVWFPRQFRSTFFGQWIIQCIRPQLTPSKRPQIASNTSSKLHLINFLCPQFSEKRVGKCVTIGTTRTVLNGTSCVRPRQMLHVHALRRRPVWILVASCHILAVRKNFVISLVQRWLVRKIVTWALKMCTDRTRERIGDNTSRRTCALLRPTVKCKYFLPKFLNQLNLQMLLWRGGLPSTNNLPACYKSGWEYALQSWVSAARLWVWIFTLPRPIRSSRLECLPSRLYALSLVL